MTGRALSIGDRDQVARFSRYVVAGPGLRDCALWTGAIADDGYARFWLSGTRVVRAHRYALALALGGHLPAGTVAMHLCDNPICVRATGTEDGEALGRHGPLAGPHVVAGTQRENLAMMAAKGRFGPAALTRAQRATRSRSLRAAVRDGWDPVAVDTAWFGGQQTLF